MFRNKVVKQEISNTDGTTVTVFAVPIRKSTFGDAWPFTVDKGVLACIPHGQQTLEIIFHANGITYAVNGTARSRRDNGLPVYADLAGIWADDPAIPGAKKKIGPLIDLAKSLPQKAGE